MATLRWGVTKDINTRLIDGTKKAGRGGSTDRWVGKAGEDEIYRWLMQITVDWSDIKNAGGKIESAALWLHTNEGFFDIGSGAALRIFRLTSSFANDGSDEWHESGYDAPKIDSAKNWTKAGGIPTTGNQPFSVDITSYLQMIAPTYISVLMGAGYKSGLGKSNFGIMIRVADEKAGGQRWGAWSDDSATPSARRPYVEVIWSPKNVRPSTTWGTPSGPSSTGTRYAGLFFDNDGQRIGAAQAKVWRVSQGVSDPNPGKDDPELPKTKWDSGEIPAEASWLDGQYDIAPPKVGVLPKMDGSTLIQYEGTARTKDSKGLWSVWTSLVQFALTSTSPTVTPTPMHTVSDVQNILFKGSWTFDPVGSRITSYRVQLTNRYDSGVWGAVLWDQVFVPTAKEQSDKKFEFAYGGPSLGGGTSPTGDYSWRVMVIDGLGEESLWAEDNTLHLSSPLVIPDDPNETTQYGRVGVTTRLIMYAVDTAHDRKPGKVVAIIENPKDLAVSGYATSLGQLSFTLPNKHPQVSVIEPMRTHWSLQQYRGSQWRDLAGGLIVDFDATENDTVFTGYDYLGVLSLSIESQGQPETQDEKKSEAQWGKGGAKYVNKTISYIVWDQLKRAIKSANSPLGFFTIPTGAIDAMDEKVTIHSAYVQRLDFIRGLLDSHRGGSTGRRTRITASRNPLYGVYQFTVRSNAGQNRKNLRFEFGGLAQAYRVMALGDWGDKVYAVGRFRNELKPHYIEMVAPGVDILDWGEIAKANVWQDVGDLNDLKRRARSMATEISRAGKRIALGLRVGGLMLLDGWNVCDNILVDIKDGTVDTSLYGTAGWWTIWGWEWRLYADGHDELTLVIRPREDVSDPVDDLIPSVPLHIQPEWSVGHGGK